MSESGGVKDCRNAVESIVWWSSMLDEAKDPDSNLDDIAG